MFAHVRAREKKGGYGVFVSVCACKREIKWPSSSAFVWILSSPNVEGCFVHHHCRGARPPTSPLTSFRRNIYHSSPTTNNRPTTWTRIQCTINPPPLFPFSPLFWLLGYLSSDGTACQQHHHLLRNSPTFTWLCFHSDQQSLIIKKYCCSLFFKIKGFQGYLFLVFPFILIPKTLKNFHVWLCRRGGATF